MNPKPPAQVYALPTNEANRLHTSMGLSIHGFTALQAEFQRVQAQLQVSRDARPLLELASQMSSMSSKLANLANTSDHAQSSDQLGQVLADQKKLLQEYGSLLKKNATLAQQKKVLFNEETQKKKAWLKEKTDELQELRAIKSAVEQASSASSVSGKYQAKKKDQASTDSTENESAPQEMSPLSREREASISTLEKDVLNSAKRLLHHLTNAEYRTRSTVSVTEQMITDPEQWVTRFEAEAMEDLDQSISDFKALIQRSEQDLIILENQINTPLSGSSSDQSNQELTSSIREASQQLHEAAGFVEVLKHILPICESIHLQVLEQVRLYQTGEFIDPMAGRRQLDQEKEIAVQTAVEIVKEARAIKNRIDEKTKGILSESKSLKVENAALKERLKELEGKLRTLLDRISTLEKQTRELEELLTDMKREKKEKQTHHREDQREWERKEGVLKEQIERLRQELINRSTELSILANTAPMQAPATTQPPIIIHPPVVPAAPSIDLSPLFTELRGLGDLIRNQGQAEAGQPIVINSPAPDNSTMLLVLEKIMSSLSGIPNALKELKNQAPDPDTASAEEIKKHKTQIAELEDQVQSLNGVMERLKQEANTFYLNWQREAQNNQALRREMIALQKKFDFSSARLETVRIALSETLKERDEAGDDRDSMMDQRDTAQRERNEAKAERDTAIQAKKNAEKETEKAEQERDREKKAKNAAEEKREEAEEAKKQAEREVDEEQKKSEAAMDSSKDAQKEKQKAERERDKAEEAKAQAETERDEANASREKTQQELEQFKSAGKTLFSRYRREATDLKVKLAEKDQIIARLEAEKAELKAQLAAALANSGNPVATETVSSPETSSMTIRMLNPNAQRSTHRFHPGEVKLETMNMNTRLQNIQFIAENLGLSAVQTMSMIAFAMPDIELIRDIYHTAWMYNDSNVAYGEHFLLNSERGSGSQLVKFIQAKVADRNLPYLESSENEVMLFSLAQSWQKRALLLKEKKEEHKRRESFLKRRIASPPDEDLLVRELVLHTNEDLKRKKQRQLPSNFCRREHESLEMSLARLISKMMPDKESTGVKILNAVLKVRRTVPRKRAFQEASKEEEMKLIKREMKGVITE